MSYKSMEKLNLCRLCANSTDDSFNIFDKNNSAVIQEIKELTGLMLRDTSRQRIARYLCIKCKEDLPRACEFRRKIIKTQHYFKSKKYKSKFLPEDPKPAFAFVPLNECDKNEKHKKEVVWNDSDETRVNSSFLVTECDQSVLEEETFHKAHVIKDDDYGNTLNYERTKKVITGKKSLDNLKNDTCFYNKKYKEYSALNCEEICLDGNISQESSTEDLEHRQDEKKLDVVIKLKGLQKLKSNNSSDKTKTDFIKNMQFSCYICQHPLESLICLKIHFRKKHKGEKFKCDLCEEKFSTIKTMVRHFRVHQGEKEFECSYCDLSFNNSSTRLRHERRSHSKDPGFLCFICGKTFITSYMGKDHLTVHTKERAYHCTICKVGFLQRAHLRNHYRSVTHKNNEQKFNDDPAKLQQMDVFKNGIYNPFISTS